MVIDIMHIDIGLYLQHHSITHVFTYCILIYYYPNALTTQGVKIFYVDVLENT